MSRFTDAWAVLTRADEPGPSDPSTAITSPTRDVSPRAVTTGDALSLSAAFRAVQIIGTSIKQLPIHAERDGIELNTQPSLIRQPNINDPRSVFLEQTAMSLATSGNAYWLKDTDGSGRVTNLTVLNAHDVTFEHTNWGRVTKWMYLGQEFRPDQIHHLKFMRVPGKVEGLGPLQAAQAELRGALDTRDYASNWFVKSGVPAGGYLSTDGFLNAEEATKNRDAWTEATANRDGLPVIGNGLKFNSVFLSPADAQWLEARGFDVAQIARLWGVPAGIMLAAIEGSSQTYSNVEQAWTEFTKFTLMAYLVEIEDALSDLLPRGTRAKFNLDALLRPDTTTRYAAHAVAITAGFLTVDEVRALEGLPPLPEPEVSSALPSAGSLPPVSELPAATESQEDTDD